MRKTLLLALLCATSLRAQVMLQGFYWDSYTASQWTRLTAQAPELGGYFQYVWVPQSGNCNTGSNSMGYMPYYFFDQDSSFGTEQELRAMIAAFAQYGIGAVADVVINHHNTDGWFTFPAEKYNGTTYQLLSTDIVADDDGGATATQAAAQGVQLSQNKDEGDGWDGCRDLDHQSLNVQEVVKAYLRFLRDDIGYAGFRYDMVKGFAASHIADYNGQAQPLFSVGEYWDSNSLIANWIKGTSYASNAFDFQFRYNVRDAINNSNWAALNSTNNLVHDATLRPYAVTFVENHDTEYRSATESQDPITADTLAANAYMLAMPGTPCVFMKHWLAYKQEIKAMIDLRNALGINSQSTYTVYSSGARCYAVMTDAVLLTALGTEAPTVNQTAWAQVDEGWHYAHYVKRTAELAWADKASGEYDGPITVRLTPVTATGATLVYTTDGTEPTAANGTRITEATDLTVAQSCTLRMGLLADGQVSKLIERDYEITDGFQPYQITVNVNTDNAGSLWAADYIHFWTWNETGNHAPDNTSWPGDKVTDTVTADGRQWFTRTYTIESKTDYVSFVFSVGGSPQTVDVTGVAETRWLQISSEKSGSNYKVDDVTESVLADVQTCRRADERADDALYDLSGRRLSAPMRGLNVARGRKFVTR